MQLGHPILTLEQARILELACLQGGESAHWDAIVAVGTGIGAQLALDIKEAQLSGPLRILLLLGKGHNAADALIAAQYILKNNPCSHCSVCWCLGKEKLKPLCEKAFHELPSCDEISVTELLKMQAPPFDVVIDGIFGLSAKGALPEELTPLFEAISVWPRCVIRAAVDFPSGILQTGPTARADFTYATGCVKAPLVALENRMKVGRLRLIDIGFYEHPAAKELEFICNPASAQILDESILSCVNALRPSQCDKRSFGQLLIIGGSRRMPGALMMAALGALKSGIGLLTLGSTDWVANALGGHVCEAMWLPFPCNEEGYINPSHWEARATPFTAVLIGPGLGQGEHANQLVRLALRTFPAPLILDADALVPELTELLAQRPKEFGSIILTPHAGEFKRLSGIDPEGQTDEALQAFCKTTGALVVLKGPLTRICSPEGSLYYSLHGGPVLARGGTGDILAAVIGASVAELGGKKALYAACCAVLKQGIAADKLAQARGQVAVRTTDLLQFF